MRTRYPCCLCCCLLLCSVGCHSRSQDRSAAEIDLAAYPACDAASYPYVPDSRYVKGPGAPLWIRRFGCEADDRAMGVVVEADGSVVATGSFGRRVSFGGRPIESGGVRDGFVVRWDNTGKPNWSMRLGGLNSEAWGTNVARGANGEIVVSGRFRGVLDATRPHLMSRATDPFVLMMEPNGTFLWGRRFDQAGYSEDGKVPLAADRVGGVLLPASLPGAAPTEGGVVRLSRFGEQPGQVKLPEGLASSLAVRENGSVLVAGIAGRGAKADPNERITVTRRGGVQPSVRINVRELLFIAEYDANARSVWSRTIGGVRPNSFGEPLVAVDAPVNAEGSSYVAFAFSGGIDVGTGLVESSGGFDLVVMKLDRVGRTVWARVFPGPQGNEWINALAVNELGDIVVGGAFERAVDFGGGPIMSAGPVSGFVARFDTSGVYLWTRVFGATESSVIVESVAFGLDKKVAVAGSFKGWTDFGGGLVPASGNWDGFVGLFAP